MATYPAPKPARHQRSRFNPMRRVTRKDTKNFSGAGKYTPTPGKGPYGWSGSPPTGVVTGFDGPDWVYAPPKSHLEMFRIIYGLGEDDPTTLQVLFKDDGWALYWSDGGHDARRLDTIFHLMESAEHPGEIIWSHLITEQWPYQTNRT